MYRMPLQCPRGRTRTARVDLGHSTAIHGSAVLSSEFHGGYALNKVYDWSATIIKPCTGQCMKWYLTPFPLMGRGHWMPDKFTYHLIKKQNIQWDKCEVPSCCVYKSSW